MPINRRTPVKPKPPAPKAKKPAAASLANIYSEFSMGRKGTNLKSKQVPPRKATPPAPKPAPKPQKPETANRDNINSKLSWGKKGSDLKRTTVPPRKSKKDPTAAPVRRPRFRGGYREMD